MNATSEFAFQLFLVVIGVPVDSVEAVVGQKEIEFLSFSDLHEFLWLI